MIENRTTGMFKEIVFVCDDCGGELETAESEFNAARDVMKREGWTSVKTDDGWEHRCQFCKPQSNAWRDFI